MTNEEANSKIFSLEAQLANVRNLVSAHRILCRELVVYSTSDPTLSELRDGIIGIGNALEQASRWD